MGSDGFGESLETLLRRERADGEVTRTLDSSMALLEPIVNVLAPAHARGIGHRDLRPATILLMPDPCDATAPTAKLSSCTTVALVEDPGAAAYRAPEQFSEAFGIAGPWTDVFALAVILVTLLSGSEPTGGRPDFEANPRSSPRHVAPRGRIPDAVDRVLVGALSVYPAERWQTAQSFWDALRSAIAVQSLAA